LIDETQKKVNGTVALKLYKGSVNAVGRKSTNSLYNMDLVTFEADQVYNQRDAEGFIKLNGLRLKLSSLRDKA
jgi:argininosuccinate synthase